MFFGFRGRQSGLTWQEAAGRSFQFNVCLGLKVVAGCLHVAEGIGEQSVDRMRSKEIVLELEATGWAK